MTVKNVDTLQQYTTTAHMDLDFIPKIQKWVGRQKYVCDEQMDDLQISIGSIFNFTLQRSTKSDAELVKEELADLKREKVSLMRDFKLFQHYFFSFWKEKSRDTLLERSYLMDQIVESPQNLYNICEGIAYVDEGDWGNRRSEYIGFRQPVAFLYHTGNSKGEENMISSKPAHMIKGEEWFEVFVSGKNFPHHLA